MARRSASIVGTVTLVLVILAVALNHVCAALHQQGLGTATSLGTPESANTAHVQARIRSGEVKCRGVNLGGWLVAEYWMTKSADVWKTVSVEDANRGEFTGITKSADQEATRALFGKHHDTFITESDIQEIAAAGLNTVRVPVGYWIAGFDDNDPTGKAEWKVFTPGTLKYLDMLIQIWAKKYNVAVMISIHAAKGSQNGADHSSPSVHGQPLWSALPDNVRQTLAVAKFLAARYKDEVAFLGIGLLNEPTGATKEETVMQYYQDAYAAIRATGNDCVLSIAPMLSKQNPTSMVGFMEAPAFRNVWVEWHPYFVWGYENTPEGDVIDVAVKKGLHGNFNVWNARPIHNRLFIGEWSFATAPGKFSGSNREQFYAFAEAQVRVLNQAGAGWTFWSWRIHGDENEFNGWSLRSVLRDARLKAILLTAN